MSRAQAWPELDAAGRSPRERGEPIGATRCGCARATCTEMTTAGRRCSGCGHRITAADWAERSAALATAHWCHVLAAAWRHGEPIPRRSGARR